MLLLSGILVLVAWRYSSLSLVPATQTVEVGAQASLDVVISGFTAHPPSIWAFDISVSFDPAILVFHSVDLDPYLGDPFLEALTAFSVSTGVLEFAEVSLPRSGDAR